MNRKGSSQQSNELIAHIKSKFLLVKLEPEVLSKFRLFFLSGKSTNKLQVESNFHLLNLISIECVGESQVVCGVEDGRRLHIRLVGTSKSIDLARALLQAVKHYFPNCTDSLKLFLDLKPAQLYAEFASLPSVKPSLPCENFRRTYAALCDLYKYPFRDEVGWDVDKIYACHDNRVLRLEDFNHLNPRDLVPIVAVLQFNSWFDGLVIDNIKIHGEKELQDVLRDVLRRSQWLKSIRLSNCGLKGEFLSLLSQAFQANPTLPLAVIDLSRNSFDDHKAAVQLGNSLSVLSGGVKEVFLEECGLSVKAVNGLANGLFNSQLNVSSLRKLSFAGNTLNHEVNDIHSLLSRCQLLEDLDLSNTGITLDKLWSALKHGGLCLRVLRVSGCSFQTKKSGDPGKASALKDYFASAVALKVVDFSDSHLPSELLKCLLLGLACNQQLNNIELDLSKSCSDRKSVPVLETSLPNVRAVQKLLLRDNSFDMDLTSLLPAIGRMPCLDSLDLGGNNFHGVRKHQPKQLTPLLMELVKIINEEDGPLRELSLADCRLGVHLSVLLNALGPSPCLRYLDISGNEMGNFGARLLAKAMQINASLNCVALDKNQITVEGFADIVHALKENHSMLSIPYPLIDACDSVARGERDKMQAVLSRMGKLLERNQTWSQKSGESDAAEKSFLTQSRLTLGNMEEELNRVEYASQQLLSECGMESSEGDVQTVQRLVEDAEKTKKLLVNMLPLFDNLGFIDEMVDKLSVHIRDEINHKLEVVGSSIAEYPERSGVSVCSNRNVFADSLMELTSKKAHLDVGAGVADFKKFLRNEYSGHAMSMAHAVTGEVIKEVSLDLATASKKLGMVAKSSSLNSLTQPPTSPSSSANLTPKTKRKQKFFPSRTSRPKSIVEGEGISENLSLDMSSSDEFPGVMNDSASSPALSLDERPSDTEIFGKEDIPAGKLLHLQKGRPKNPNKRMPTRRRFQEAPSEIDSGLTDFFGSKSPEAPTPGGGSPKTPLNKDTRILPTVNEMDETGSDEGPQSPFRQPPGGVPVITAEMLQQKRKPMTPSQSLSPPRVPPNTPMTPGLFDPILPPKLPSKPKHKLASEEEEVKNGWVVLDQVESSTKVCTESGENVYAEIDNKSPASLPSSDDSESTGKTDSNATTTTGTSSSADTTSVTQSSSADTSEVSSDSSKQTPSSVTSSLSDSWKNTTTGKPPPSDSVPFAKPGLPPKPDVPSEGLVKMRNMNAQQGLRPKTQLIGGSVGENGEKGGSGDQQNKKDQRKSVMDLKGMFEKQQPPKPAPRSSKNKISPTAPSRKLSSHNSLPVPAIQVGLLKGRKG